VSEFLCGCTCACMFVRLFVHGFDGVSLFVVFCECICGLDVRVRFVVVVCVKGWLWYAFVVVVLCVFCVCSWGFCFLIEVCGVNALCCAVVRCACFARGFVNCWNVGVCL